MTETCTKWDFCVVPEDDEWNLDSHIELLSSNGLSGENLKNQTIASLFSFMMREHHFQQLMECEMAATESEIQERTREYVECMKDMWDYFQQVYLPHYQIDPGNYNPL